MNVRIISGKYGGRIIAAPPGDRTHPMGERVRNALFNSLGDLVQGANVLDAFAGTGAVGIEAISRGAKFTTFVEKDRVAQKVLQENLEKLGATDETKLVKAPVASWADSYDGPKFDIIIADPPYHNLQLSTVSRLIGLLKPNGLMVLSHTGSSESTNLPGVVVVDNRGYGTAVLTYFHLEK